jgi:hypothetical protein
MEASNYVRVGTLYLKFSDKPLMSGDTMKVLLPWNLDSIIRDHGKDFVNSIKKYDGWCIVPDHLNYQKVIKKYLNRYEEIPHMPQLGSCDNILNFVNHIFGEQYELGLDYIQLLYQRPVQILPVLCLVSKERESGKTTFLNFLKLVFCGNMTYNSNSDFRSNFNIDWLNKLIIAVDEVLLDRKEDSERIKNLSTARSFKAEAKGQDKFEVEFFGKFILCSNNEENFIIIDPLETRYWVRKILPIKDKNPHLLEQLEVEIPNFLHFLSARTLSTTNKTRMWFTAEQISTAALKRIQSKYSDKTELELFEILKEIMECTEMYELKFANVDAKILLERSGYRVNRTTVRQIIEDAWGLSQHPCSSPYLSFTYDSSGFLYKKECKGRYYTIDKTNLLRISNRLLT